MSVFSVKTRRNEDPKAKNHVYISSHPDDRKNCAEILKQELLEIHDCAVYQLKEDAGHATIEDLKSYFTEIQLFVVAITSRYLDSSCPFLYEEFTYAMENNIPVLPIVMESNLSELFIKRMNQVKDGYGNIQFLDHTSMDPSEISYEKKLENKVSSILLGDEMLRRIRSAFSAYIFLSYRKKDRNNAKELMKLIHKIPFCEDYAIWYDEFLSPGEVWSDAIARAMTKSVLVVMAVTPSITEKDNYVVSNEYPYARQTGKPILPAEIIPTNINRLHQLLPDLPETIDCQNEEQLRIALKDALGIFVQSDKIRSSEENYLLGLAYLQGIDVERDVEKGIKFIEKAADEGLEEALKKLLDIYGEGIGVQKNIQKQLRISEQLTEIYRSRMKKEPSHDNFGDFTESLQKLGELQIKCENYASVEKTVAELKMLAEDYKNQWTVVYTYERYYEILRELNLKKGNMEEVEKYTDCIIELLESAIANKEITRSGIEFIILKLQFQKARMRYENGKEDVQKKYLKIIKNIEELSADEKSDEILFLYIYIHLEMAKEVLLNGHGDLKQAVDWAKIAYETSLCMNDILGYQMTRTCRVYALSAYASLLGMKGDHKQALELSYKGFKETQQLSREYSIPDVRTILETFREMVYNDLLLVILDMGKKDLTGYEKASMPSKVYAREQLTEKRLMNIRKKLDSELVAEDVFLFIDTTLNGNANKGILFTNKAFIGSDFYAGSQKKPIFYKDLKKVELGERANKIVLTYKDDTAETIFGSIYTGYLLEVLHQIMKYPDVFC